MRKKIHNSGEIQRYQQKSHNPAIRHTNDQQRKNKPLNHYEKFLKPRSINHEDEEKKGKH